MMDTQHGGRVSVDDHTKLVDFEDKFRIQNSDTSVLSWIVRHYVTNFSLKESFLGHFPVIETLRTYKWKDYILKDVISGVMSGVMMIPLGLAYAFLSTLPPVIGLYMAFFASITYFIFGTSRHLSWGCVAMVSLMMANLIVKYDNSEDCISYISSLNLSQTHQHANTISHEVSNSNLQDLTPSPSSNNIYSSGGVGAAMLNSLENTTDKNKILEMISARRIEVASSIAVIAGTVLVIESLIGLSCFTPIMSNSLMAGFTLGIAFNIATSQLSVILGLSIKRYSGNFCVFKTWIAVIDHIKETNVAVLVISIICIFVMYLVKRLVNEKYGHRMRVPIPIELLIVIIAILISKYCHFNEIYDVGVLGVVPMGIPSPKLPNVSLVFTFDYIVDALVIVVIAHVEAFTTAKTIASEDRRAIKPGQEMFAAGIGSIVCALFSGYIPGSSIPISTAQRDSGGMTQIASLFAAGIVLLVIMVLGPYFYALPNCVMSAVILINLRPLFVKVFTLPEEWRRSKHDCLVLVCTCIATIVLEAGNAIFFSVACSVFLVVLLRAMINPVVEVVPIKIDQKSALILRQTEQYVSAKTLLSVRLIKIKTPLYFYNSDSFVDAVFVKTDIYRTQPNILRHRRSSWFRGTKTSLSDTEALSTSKINETTPLVSTDRKKTLSRVNWKTIIVDMSEVSFMDVMGVEALDFVINEFQSAGITVLITSVSDNVFGILRTTGFWKRHRDSLITDVQSALASVHTTPQNYNPLDARNGVISQSNQWV